MNTNNQPFYGACAVIYRKADGTQHRIAALVPTRKCGKDTSTGQSNLGWKWRLRTSTNIHQLKNQKP